MRALYCAAILALLTPTPSGAQWGDDAVTLLTTEKALVGAPLGVPPRPSPQLSMRSPHLRPSILSMPFS